MSRPAYQPVTAVQRCKATTATRNAAAALLAQLAARSSTAAVVLH